MPAPKGTMYIPRSIKLPGGFKVTVKQIRPMQMKAKHGQFLDGCWDIDTMSLDILKTLNHKRKWFVYSHEYQHVVHDWVLFLVNKGVSQG